MSKFFHDGRIVLHAGDCLEVLGTFAENSIDAIVTDPPYHLTTGKKGGTGVASLNPNSPAGRSIIGTGFMGKEWDGGDIAFRPETWAKVLRVLKPGGHLVAFAAPKCSHRMVCAIEDAGFEIRDGLMWLFGSGFPKSLDVSKAIDKSVGAEREVVGHNPNFRERCHGDAVYNGGQTRPENITAPASDDARKWEGWGTSLKPAYEPICLARKPLGEATVAANVLKHGTGAINVDACRVGNNGGCAGAGAGAGAVVFSDGLNGTYAPRIDGLGRWPANICHDGGDEVVAAFPDSSSGALTADHQANGGFKGAKNCYGTAERGGSNEYAANSGSAARFFYSAKADASDRFCSKHPTVKPLALMRWLVRLVTPPGGTVLDCFAGTGSTGHAALLEGFNAILIEREAEYRADIERRMSLVFAGEHETTMATKKQDDHSALPLFSGTNDAGGGNGRLVYGKFARDARSGQSD